MLKAMGRPYFAMLVLGGTVVLNLLLNLLFVGVFGWGTAGSGLATGIAFTTSFAVMAPALLKKAVWSVSGKDVSLSGCWVR